MLHEQQHCHPASLHEQHPLYLGYLLHKEERGVPQGSGALSAGWAVFHSATPISEALLGRLDRRVQRWADRDRVWNNNGVLLPVRWYSCTRSSIYCWSEPIHDILEWTRVSVRLKSYNTTVGIDFYGNGSFGSNSVHKTSLHVDE